MCGGKKNPKTSDYNQLHCTLKCIDPHLLTSCYNAILYDKLVFILLD